MKLYTPKEASRLLGVSVKTIRRWDKSGRIKCFRIVGGKRRIPESEVNRLLGTYNEDRVVVGYVRVSSHTQKDDSDRQVKLIRRYAFEYGYGDIVVLRDVGSGLNEDRRGFRRLLKMIVDNMVSKVIVAYPDRLTRFGFKTLEYFFKIHGTNIIVINHHDKTPQEELVEDLIMIISHFAGKLYGIRSHRYPK